MTNRPCAVNLIDNNAVNMRDCVVAVEKILQYKFKDTTLLEKALTHSSYTKSESYERLEFIGDSALGFAITNYIFLTYPDATPGNLTLLRSTNTSTEKFARVAVRHRLFMYVRHNAASLDEQVREFCEAVQEEDDTLVVYGGAVNAPKVLADIVEAVAAAVYIDERFDLQKMWLVVRGLLEPLTTLDMLMKEPQPVTKLFEACQKNGKQVDIKLWREGDKNIASVYIDSHLIASASSKKKENAKLQAAKAALQKLELHDDKVDICSSLNESGEIEAAKQKLHEMCGKKKWSKPNYSIEKEVGPAHSRKFVCSVSFEKADGEAYVKGEEKLRVRDAELSAASTMLHYLRQHNYL